MDAGLLLLRAAGGLLLTAHGASKLSDSFGDGYGPAETAAYLHHLGFHPATGYVWLLGGTEIAAGAGLTLGLLTPLAGAGCLGLMSTALTAAHPGRGPWIANEGAQLAGVLAALGAALPHTGPGRYSLDHALGLDLSGPRWGATALATGLGAAALALTRRATTPGTPARPQTLTARPQGEGSAVKQAALGDLH